MTDNDIYDQPISDTTTRKPTAAIGPAQSDVAAYAPMMGERCPACEETARMRASYIYAIGHVEARFPNLSIEKEFSQAIGRAQTAGHTDQEVFAQAFSQRENRYLAREMCWVFSVQGLETYVLQPRDPGDFDRLVEAVRPRPSPLDIDVIVGVRGPMASPESCNGLMVPVVRFDQIYSFDRDSLIKSIPKADGADAESFRRAAYDVFDRILQVTDNAGSTDEHRALNYLTMRYPGIYATASDEFAREFALTAVYARPSTLSGTRRIVDVIFAYANRNSDFTEKFLVRVDVTEEFPFLITKMMPYFDR
jgi:hypothetical protein